MKKNIQKAIIFVLCLSMVCVLPALAAEPDDTLSKEELYEMYMTIIEERNELSRIKCEPSSFEDFEMSSAKDIEKFAAVFDSLIEYDRSIPDELKELQKEWLTKSTEPQFSQADLNERGKTKNKFVNVHVAERPYSIRVAANLSTMLHGGVQVFNPQACSVSFAYAMAMSSNKWTTTANGSHVDDNNPQRYIAYADGKLYLEEFHSTFSNLQVTAYYYCSDTGVIS